MFGSNPFVSSFSQPQNATGQNTWSSGPQNTQNGQNQQWGGYQPWGMNNNIQGSYGSYGTNSSMGSNGMLSSGGVGSGSSQYPYQQPHVDSYNQPPGQSGQYNPYSPYPYGQTPSYGNQGSYTPNGWMPAGYGQQNQMPPWLSGGGGMNGGMTGGMGGGMPPGMNPLSRFPGQPQSTGSSITDPTALNYGTDSVGGSNPMNRSGGLSNGQQQPYQFQNYGMVYNPPNTNNPSAYAPAPTTPSFVPDIIARMMYGDKGYTGSNGLYINPNGSWSM